MVHFYNGERTEDYVTLVDSEVIPEVEAPNEDPPQQHRSTPQELVKKTEFKSNVLIVRIIKIILVLALAITIVVLSYNTYIQGSEITSLRIMLAGEQNTWTKLGFKSAPQCVFSVSDLQFGYQRSRRIGEQKGSACVDACLHMKQIDDVINGVTVYVDETKKGCWCQRNMTSISKRFKACFLKSNVTTTKTGSIDSNEYACKFQPGDGTGGSEVKVGNQKGNACINACLHLKQFDNTVNGVTAFADSSRAGCWCEKGMVRVYNLNTYKTCYLLPRYNFTQRIDTNVCNFSIGYASGGAKFFIGKRNGRQCVDDCLHMRRVDPSINGVTINPKEGNCWCGQGMRNITGRYNTCFLKPRKEMCAENATRMCERYTCNFSIGHGAGASSHKIGEQRGRVCVDACVHMKKIDPSINGITIYSDPTKGGCFCRYNMTKIDGTYRTCFLKPTTIQPLVQFNVTKPACQLALGDGNGGTEIYLGKLLRNVCFKACLHLKKIDNSVNGMTVHSNVSRAGCWCEKRMRGVRTSRLYKTCKFKYNNTNNASNTTSVCNFSDGAGVGTNPLNRGYIGRVNEGECMDSCVHMRRINPSINGITRSTITGRCWCESNMKSIGEYKTCFIKS